MSRRRDAAAPAGGTPALHHFFHTSGFPSTIGDYDLLRELHTRRAHRAMFALSGIVLTAVFAFAMYLLARRDRTFLLLGNLCLAAAALLISEAWRSLYGYMSLRKDIAYELEIDGVDGSQLVPPAVFHTLVENAITHGSSMSPVTMRLSWRDARYVFESPLDPADDRTPRAGSGTRYIEARLREAFGDAWSFQQGRAGDVWRAELSL